jgi:hypothetical protein
MVSNKIYPTAREAIMDLCLSLKGPSAIFRTPKIWQSLELKKGVRMIEVLDNFLRINMSEDLDLLIESCKPDLPWADKHFSERLYGFPTKGRIAFSKKGVPTNPGNTFLEWPYYKEDKYRENGFFSHTYQERFWPENINGIRYPYGNFQDVVNQLAKDPDTRQAYFPIWFPEDTGAKHGDRVPCSLGYLFYYRSGYLHLSYDLRSCDPVRHLCNDVYFAMRLAKEVLTRLRESGGSTIDWNKVHLGNLSLHITSLHIFESDLLALNKKIIKFQ